MTKLHRYLLPKGSKVIINIHDFNWVNITTTEIAVLTVKDIYHLPMTDFRAADDQLYNILTGGKNNGINYHFTIQGYRVEINPTKLQILE